MKTDKKRKERKGGGEGKKKRKEEKEGKKYIFADRCILIGIRVHVRS